MECLTCSENLELQSPRNEDLNNAQLPKKAKIDPAQSITCVTPCGHLFHRKCLYQHFEAHATGNGNDNPESIPTGGNCPECDTYVKSKDLYPVLIIRKGHGGTPSNDKRPGGTGFSSLGEPPSVKSDINELKVRIIELEEKLEAMDEEMQMKTALLQSLTEEHLREEEEEEGENVEDENYESGEEEEFEEEGALEEDGEDEEVEEEMEMNTVLLESLNLMEEGEEDEDYELGEEEEEDEEEFEEEGEEEEEEEDEGEDSGDDADEPGEDEESEEEGNIQEEEESFRE